METLQTQGIRDLSVLHAIDEVPRHLFVPTGVRHRAYEDSALPIGNGQTISQPSIHARYLELLKLTGKEKILEIGTGSGYQTALLSRLASQVFSIERIAPLLWMRAGSEGRRIDERTDTFDVADTYAVLFNVDASKPFLDSVEKAEGLRIAYIVTDDETQYQAVAGQLPDGVESVRLYESYLRTFQINTGRA